MSDRTPNGPRPGPLAGIRVVDMTIWMAGAVSGMLLADLGADVVKVEGRSGDPTRSHTAPTAGAAAGARSARASPTPPATGTSGRSPSIWAPTATARCSTSSSPRPTSSSPT